MSYDTFMKRILLLNGETVQVVCMARALAKAGHQVSSLCDARCSSGYATRYVQFKYISPEVTNESAFISFFYNHIKNHSYDLIIPMFDTSADFLSKNKEKIESEYGIKCAVPTYHLFNIANDKQLLMELCEKYNLPHPRTRELKSTHINEAADYVGFPSLIKPNISGGAKGIVRVNCIDDILDKLPSIEKQYGACTLQQYVNQPDYYYNVMLYRTKKGDIAGYTIIKIRRYFPLKGGSSCYCETIDHPFLLEMCQTVLEKLNWVGFADIDVLEDIRSGELKIIEINPRTPSSLQASFAAGIDFGKIIVADEFDEPMPIFHYLVDQQIRWMGLDFMWFLFSPNRFRFTPSWFRFFGNNVSYHDGTWKDPLPMFAGMLAGFLKYLNPEFRKSKLDN